MVRLDSTQTDSWPSRCGDRVAHDYSTGGLSNNCLAYIVAARVSLPANVVELSASRGRGSRGGEGWWCWKGIGSTLQHHADPERVRLPDEAAAAGDASSKRPVAAHPQIEGGRWDTGRKLTSRMW